MPAFYAHKLFGESVFAALPTPLKDALNTHREAFILGTQGPDFLFYHKPLSKNDIRAKAWDLHLNSARPFFINCAQKIRKSADTAKTSLTQTAIGAYVAGFICHFMLDTSCHPHVYELEDTGVSHGLIESEFDKYLKRERGEKVHKNAAKILSKCGGVIPAVSCVLEIDEKSAKRALSTMKTINGMFSCPFKTFHKLAKVVLKKRNAIKFESMFIHFDNDPACDTLNPVLYEDFKNAIMPTAELIGTYFNAIENNALDSEVYIQFDKNYEGVSLL